MTQTEAPVTIRQADGADFPAIWTIFHEIVSHGDTYAYDPATTAEEAQKLWLPPGGRTYVAELGGVVTGTYLLKPNQPGLGSHVANAGYMVAPQASGSGIGRAMCEHSLQEARNLGFTAMQFNNVVSTNERAIALWQRLGFNIVGQVPQAFRHPDHGFVDIYIMHRFL